MKRIIFSRLVLGLVLLLGIQAAQAIPAFARKGQIPCSTCHTAWPALNAFGRQYKEHGYRLGEMEVPKDVISDDLKLDDRLPISALIVARPYDKKDSGEAKNRALHEAEVIVAGPMSERVSGFIEIEAEDEDGFSSAIPAAALTYRMNAAAYLQFSWSNNTWFDPYLSYTTHGRLTRSDYALVDQAFGGADNALGLRKSRQNFTLYGRPMPKLFYGISLGGDADDTEGEQPDTVTARLAYDFSPELMLGILAVDGTCDQRGVAGDPCFLASRNYSRNAIDLQAEFDAFTVNAVYMQATDDNATATAELENNAYYVQALYTVQENGRVTWAPILRYEKYEKNNGSEDIGELTLSLNYYFSENVRGMVEYWDRSGDGTTLDDDRITVQLFAAF